jgi:hypothetical protein
MAILPSDIQKILAEETDVESPVSEQLFQKFGKTLNGLIDQFNGFQLITASGPYVVPDNISRMAMLMCGGGGGGGAGGNGNTGNFQGRGGSGGRGATPILYITETVPADSWTVTIGAGGSGGVKSGASGGSGGGGNAGGNTTVVASNFSYRVFGGEGGLGGAGGASGDADTGVPSPTVRNGGFLNSSDSGVGGSATGTTGKKGGVGGISIYNFGTTFPGGGHFGADGDIGGGGGGAGGNSLGLGGFGGHGGNTIANGRYAGSSPVRAGGITTLTVSGTGYTTNNFNVGEYVGLDGFSSGFNGYFEIVAVPTTSTIRVANPGADGASGDTSGFVYPSDTLSGGVDNLKSGRGGPGILGSGGGAGGGGGGGFTDYIRGGPGGTGGAGFILLMW